MNNKKLTVVMLGLLGFAAAGYARNRLATIDGVRVTHRAANPHLVAEVTLDYSAGTRPAYLIIDLRSGSGSGSATIEGDDDSAQIALTELAAHADLTLTAATRRFGRLIEQRFVFAVPVGSTA